MEQNSSLSVKTAPTISYMARCMKAVFKSVLDDFQKYVNCKAPCSLWPQTTPCIAHKPICLRWPFPHPTYTTIYKFVIRYHAFRTRLRKWKNGDLAKYCVAVVDITSFSYPEFAYIICTRARGKSGLTLTRPSLTQQESSNPKPTDNTKGCPYSMGQPCANGWFGVENKAKCILTCTLHPCLERLVVP